MRPRSDDAQGAPGIAGGVIASVRGEADDRHFRHPPRSVVVTDRRVLVFDKDRLVGDLPRRAVDVIRQRPDELVVAGADQRFTLRLPASEREHAAELAQALRHEPFVVTLCPVDLPHRTQRALGLGVHEHISLVLTRRRLLLLARHGAHTEAALDCPRAAVRVRSHQSVWPGGDLLFDRIVLEAGDTLVELDVDGHLHDRACCLVAALRVAHDRSKPTRITRKANS